MRRIAPRRIAAGRQLQARLDCRTRCGRPSRVIGTAVER
jgi:hypothetical protein